MVTWDDALTRAGVSAGTPVRAPWPTDGLEADGLYRFSLEAVWENGRMHAELTSPERRLSDHLNGSAPMLELRPLWAQTGIDGPRTELAGRTGQVNKASILFVIPRSEPPRPARKSNYALKPTTARPCWLRAGGHTIRGTLYTEAGRDPLLSLRLLDRQFLPLTGVEIADSAGRIAPHDVIIINRARLDILALL